MKPTYFHDPALIASSSKLNTYENNFINMCDSHAKAGQAIIPLKSKLYYDEKRKFI